MKIRTCGACKALVTGNLNDHCVLGNKIECTQRINYTAVKFRPVSGECEKPRNNTELTNLLLASNSAKN